MKAIVGLGNPGEKYRGTRHNVGFRVLDELYSRHGKPKPKVRFESELAEVQIDNEKVLLLAPQTYMNLSGRAVERLVSFYQLPLQCLMVVSDDMNLETGRLRMRPGGSAGGQKGLQNIIDRLGSEEFPRLRIGVGRPPQRLDASDHVLSRIRNHEIETVDRAISLAAEGLETWAVRGLNAAMNLVNAPADDGNF